MPEQCRNSAVVSNDLLVTICKQFAQFIGNAVIWNDLMVLELCDNLKHLEVLKNRIKSTFLRCPLFNLFAKHSFNE